jgi:hypothetical protein
MARTSFVGAFSLLGPGSCRARPDVVSLPDVRTELQPLVTSSNVVPTAIGAASVGSASGADGAAHERWVTLPRTAQACEMVRHVAPPLSRVGPVARRARRCADFI